MFDIYIIIMKNFVFVVGEYDWYFGLRKNFFGKNFFGKRNYFVLKCSIFIKILCEIFDNV